MQTKSSLSLFDAALVKPALWGAFAKLTRAPSGATR
jgi:K+-transporting ATPase ATPase B chain